MTSTDNRPYTRIRTAIGNAVPGEAGNIAAVMLAPADLAVLVGRAMLSADVHPQIKAYLIMAGLYTSSGIDIIPEAILGPIGLADDGIVILEALHRLLNETQPGVIDDLWPGEIAVLRTIQRWVFETREGVQHSVVRPIARWIRRAIGQAVAGQGV